ncbi:hypothetical protein GC177_07005 [bacterium]|nr:hypothetical protein [bacterium]
MHSMANERLITLEHRPACIPALEFLAGQDSAIRNAERVEWSFREAKYGGHHDKITFDLMECVGVAAVLYDSPEHLGQSAHVVDTALIHLYPDEAEGVHDFLHTLKTGHSFEGVCRLEQPFDPKCTLLFIAGARHRTVDNQGLDMVHFIKTVSKNSKYGYIVADECLGGKSTAHKSLLVLGGRVYCAYTSFGDLLSMDPASGESTINIYAKDLSIVELTLERENAHVLRPGCFHYSGQKLQTRGMQDLDRQDLALKEAAVSCHAARMTTEMTA